jgi:hypothetical protein
MSEPRKEPPITVSKNKRIIMLVFLTLHTGAIKRHVIDLELDICSPRLACIFCVVTQLFFDGEHYNRGSSHSFTEAPTAACSIRPDVPATPGMSALLPLTGATTFQYSQAGWRTRQYCSVGPRFVETGWREAPRCVPREKYRF